MKTKRRDFFKKVGAATAGLILVPTIVKASALGREGNVPPSDRLNMILIGAGAMGRRDLLEFLKFNETQATAVCDIDDKQIAAAKKMIDENYGNSDCRVYKDYREILEKEDADAAILALPDHWHALIGVAAVNKKLDVYGEKPLARSIVESRAIVDAVQKNNVLWQMGSLQRSAAHFHHAAELVRNGRIGKVNFVEVGLPDGGQYIGNPSVQAVPEGVDWDMWLGPAPKVPFRGILHWNWRWIMDYSGGQLTDWAGHHIDIAHWGLGLETSGPVTIEGTGRANNDGIYNVPVVYDFTCKYANGLEMRVANQSQTEHGMGTIWKGTDGWIHVYRGGIKASDDAILKEKIGRDEVQLYKSTNHWRSFIDSVKTRDNTVAPVESGHSSITVGLLGEIAMITRQKLNWDPETEQFRDNNTHATRLLKRPYRAPWSL